jgi:hypothetical protein
VASRVRSLWRAMMKRIARRADICDQRNVKRCRFK